jgi:hypothetical protein
MKNRGDQCTDAERPNPYYNKKSPLHASARGAVTVTAPDHPIHSTVAELIDEMSHSNVSFHDANISPVR